mmetsp:Transcript_31604/g.73564  ORF Transcript_31604/g.73564 Transcript_31604/m.73564 type:complete len:212 (+) Transcript_31604:634-1269(+)
MPRRLFHGDRGAWRRFTPGQLRRRRHDARARAADGVLRARLPGDDRHIHPRGGALDDHIVDQGWRGRGFQEHAHAVPQGTRRRRLRLVQHLQRVREAVGERPQGADPWARRDSRRSAGLGRAARHRRGGPRHPRQGVWLQENLHRPQGAAAADPHHPGGRRVLRVSGHDPRRHGKGGLGCEQCCFRIRRRTVAEARPRYPEVRIQVLRGCR